MILITLKELSNILNINHKELMNIFENKVIDTNSKLLYRKYIINKSLTYISDSKLIIKLGNYLNKNDREMLEKYINNRIEIIKSNIELNRLFKENIKSINLF